MQQHMYADTFYPAQPVVPHHNYDGAMHTAAEERIWAAQPTDRRPDFCAEAMSPTMRVGVLLASLFAASTVVIVLVLTALFPHGVFSIDPFFAVMSIGILIGTGFFTLLIFGALLGNNPRIGFVERVTWWASFVLLGPFVLPLYWAMHVWPVPYQPTGVQRL